MTELFLSKYHQTLQGSTIPPINTSLLSTHPINTPYQHILTTHPLKTSYQPTLYFNLSTHPHFSPFQHTPSTHPINRHRIAIWLWWTFGGDINTSLKMSSYAFPCRMVILSFESASQRILINDEKLIVPSNGKSWEEELCASAIAILSVIMGVFWRWSVWLLIALSLSVLSKASTIYDQTEWYSRSISRQSSFAPLSWWK